jgi:hypothetical protein
MMPLDPIVGGTTLRIPAIQSPNFSIPNQTGWAIEQNGAAYFFQVTVNGDVIIASASGGVFLYSGPPATGNLIGWWTAAAGTDAYGNTYTASFDVGMPGTSNIELTPNANTPFDITTSIAGIFQAAAQFFTSDADEVLPGILGSVELGTGTAAKMATVLQSPFGTAGAAVVLEAQNDGATDTPVITFGTVTTPDDTTTIFTPVMTLTPYALLLYGGSSGQVTVTKTSGSGTIPTPVSPVKAEVWGGGSGGASQNGSSPPIGIPSAGGAGGEYACEPNLVVGATVAYSVGAGGAGSNPGIPIAQQPGGNSTLTGSAVTVTGHGAAAPTGNASAGTGGVGGHGSGNTTHFNGGSGGNVSQPVLSDQEGAGGGSSGGTSAAGNAGTSVPSGNQFGSGAAGGSAPAGGGAGGAGGTETSSSANPGVGQPGNAPGGGGGGGGMGNSVGENNIGGAGANGQVRVTYSTGAPPILFSVALASGTDQFGTAYSLGVYSANPFVIENPSSPGTAEIWHAMSLINTWANVGGGVVDAQYRLIGSPPKEVEVIGEISGGVIGNGTNINSALPSGYQPVSTQTITIRLILGAGTAPIMCYARISTTGQIALEGIPAGTTRIAFHDTFSLDA